MNQQLKPLLKKLLIFAKDRLKFKRPPRLFFKQDQENSKCMLGKTAHYDPQNMSVTLYTVGRHPKDILRSFAHELVHHCQNERGDLSPEKLKTMNNNYAQENEHMRKMEQEAYLQGNMCFRDWEDGLDDKLQYKMKLAEQKFLKENKNMSVKISKIELKGLIEKLLKERVKKDANDRVQGRRAGGRRLKPLEETEELDENGCGGKGKKEDGGPGTKVDCENCKGKGCEQCKKPLEEVEENEVDPLQLKNTIQITPNMVKTSEKKPKAAGEKRLKASSVPAGGTSVDDKKNNQKKTTNEELEGLEEKKKKKNKNKGKYDDGDGKDERCDYVKCNESAINTPEQENALYESRFTQRNTRLFEKLLKEWTK